jgi:hypothetical protein
MEGVIAALLSMRRFFCRRCPPLQAEEAVGSVCRLHVFTQERKKKTVAVPSFYKMFSFPVFPSPRANRS